MEITFCIEGKFTTKDKIEILFLKIIIFYFSENKKLATTPLKILAELKIVEHKTKLISLFLPNKKINRKSSISILQTKLNTRNSTVLKFLFL